MDVILGNFARGFLTDASDDEIAHYEDLLKENDPDLYNWISQREPVPENKHNPVLEKLIGYQVIR